MTAAPPDLEICTNCGAVILFEKSWWPQEYPLCDACYALYREDQRKGNLHAWEILTKLYSERDEQTTTLRPYALMTARTRKSSRSRPNSQCQPLQSWRVPSTPSGPQATMERSQKSQRSASTGRFTVSTTSESPALDASDDPLEKPYDSHSSPQV